MVLRTYRALEMPREALDDRPDARRRGALMLAFLAVVSASEAAAQITGSNLLEVQVGNYPKSFPDRGPTNRQDFYDQVNLEYLFGTGIVGARFETNRNSLDEFPYESFTQRYLEWSDDRYRIRVGNFYTILGRGLVHRSFELTGVVLDQRFPRSRYTPQRDMDGVLAEATVGPVSAKLLSGAANGGESSPAAEEFFQIPRHRGQLSGGQLAVNVYRDAHLGVAYLRSKAGSGQQEVGSGFLELDPLHIAGIEGVSLPLYVEYAQVNRSFGEWWRLHTSTRVPHALYASTNLLWGPVGFSAEWKDYAQFRFGTNDPPSLVREHGQTLLNRSTHVLDPGQEAGFQLEGSYVASEWAALTINASRADGVAGFRFEELFFELRSAPRGGERWEATVFYDRGRDDIVGIATRTTYGVASTARVFGPVSATLDLERQTAEREGFLGLREPFEDVYLAFTTAAANLGSAAFVWVRTTDPLDPSRADPGSKPLHLVGVVLSGRLSPRHEAILFAGRRRGGLACTAGTCYEVQPFEGAELRLISRF